MKKYLIRVIGALCILGALALMFMPAWLELDDLKRSELRDLRSDITGASSAVSEAFVDALDNEEFEEELEDYDLPHTRGKIKSHFKTFENMTEELLDEKVSLQELMELSMDAPKVLTVTENLLDSDLSQGAVRTAARYLLQEGNFGEGEDYGGEEIGEFADELGEVVEEGFDVIDEISFLFPLLTIALGLILALGLAAAVTHICNKGRWVKYLFMVILVGMVVGTCVALPMVMEALVDVVADLPAFEDVTLKITATPFIAVALTSVPFVLDIIFERKKQTILLEDAK